MTARPFAGRTVMVLGAAGGIGEATARRLAALGARVVLGGLEAARLRRIADELIATRAAVLAQRVDVTDASELGWIRDLSVRAYGAVDAVVNCAAVLAPGPVDRLTDADVRRQIETNLLGTVLVTRVFLPLFRRQGRGHFVHIASLGGIVPLPDSAVYSATKFGVRGFCLAMALELRGTGIEVTAVCPDSVDTPQLRIEAVGGGASLSFTSPPMTPAVVASAICHTLLHPRAEVLVPGARGVLAKLLAFSPALFGLLHPALDRRGRRGRDRYLGWRYEPALLLQRNEVEP